MLCWSCQKAVAPSAGDGDSDGDSAGLDNFFCPHCKALLPPVPGQTYFEILGLQPAFAVDMQKAERNFHQRSRQFHPDRFAKADAQARKASLAQTVKLNEAWATLKDPSKRAAYMLKLAGRSEQQGSQSGSANESEKVPQELLMEMLELRSELGEARLEGDVDKVAAMAADMNRRYQVTLDNIAEGLAEPAPAGLDKAQAALVELRYYRRFLDEVADIQEQAGPSAQDGLAGA